MCSSGKTVLEPLCQSSCILAAGIEKRPKQFILWSRMDYPKPLYIPASLGNFGKIKGGNKFTPVKAQFPGFIAAGTRQEGWMTVNQHFNTRSACGYDVLLPEAEPQPVP
jgi:hypothetical protein